MKRNFQTELFYTQLMQAVLYALSGFDKTLMLFDVVTSNRIAAGDLFEKMGKRFFMKGESVLGDMCLKAIAIDTKALFIETSPLDADEVKRTLQEEEMGVTYDPLHGLFKAGKTTLIRITTRPFNAAEEGLAPRCLWTISWPKLSLEERELAVCVADAIYGQNAFSHDVVDGDSGAFASSGTPRQEQRLQLGLLQQLQMEQRPVLSMEYNYEARAELQMSQELRHLLVMQHRMDGMGETELQEYLAAAGPTMAMKTFLFVLAGRFKRALAEQDREVTWREARRLARVAVSRSTK